VSAINNQAKDYSSSDDDDNLMDDVEDQNAV
jgi:hypothetical protein